MADIWMGAQRQHTTLSQAVGAAQAGDTIYIDAGTYLDNYVTINKPLTLVGVGGMAHFHNTVDIPNKKGIIVTYADLTVQNLEFSGATVVDDNGAGIRYHGGTLVVRNSSFHDNQEGILGGADPSGRIEIHDSSFIRNGTEGDRTHGAYVGAIDTLLVVDSLFQDTYVGSHLKSRAANTEVYNSRFIDGDGPTNYGIDLSNGGNATIVGNYMEQEANTNNRTMITYGSEAQNPGNLVVTDNTLVNHRSSAVGVFNHTINSVTVEDNVFVNVSIPISGGASAAGNTSVTLARYLANAAPVAADDGATTDTGMAALIDVLANDSDADGDAIAIASVGAAAHGSVADNGDGTLTYTPEAGFVGDDSFAYTVRDGVGGSASATVAVTIVDAADPVPAGAIAFDAGLFSSYAGSQDRVRSQTVSDDGTTVEFNGNTWRKMAIDYTVTADTVLSFDFRSTHEGEVQGIALETNDSWGDEVFQVYGTQGNAKWDGGGDLYTGNGDWQSFTVDIGTMIAAGDKSYLAFLNDDDSRDADGHSAYRNVRIYEPGAAPDPVLPAEDPAPVDPPPVAAVTLVAGLFSSYAGSQDRARSQTVSDDGTTVEFNGNTWRKMAIDCTVTADTVLSFDFRSTHEGEVQGIALETNDSWGDEVFQVYGTQGNAKWDGGGDLYTGNGDWQSFTVDIGTMIAAGDKSYLAFLNDDDSRDADGHSAYRNIRLYEADQAPLLGVQDSGADPLLG